jgi:hypothetical protein
VELSVNKIMLHTHRREPARQCYFRYGKKSHRKTALYDFRY